MSSYAISPILNKNRVFILQKSEMEKRLDPAFYYEIINNKFEFRHPTKTISRIVKSYSGGTPDKSTPNYWNGEICWASPKDMKDFYLSDTEDKITEEGLNNSAATLAPTGSILIVFRSGILQHTLPVSITTTKTAINQDLKVLIPSEEVIPEYLAVFLKTFEKRILPRIVKHSTTVQSINQEEFNQLSVPIPEIAVQKRIIEINRKSIKQKKQNEAEAEKLLLSIDDYLLKELDITLPEKPENTLKSRIFTSTITTISGDRFDPYHHQIGFTKTIAAIRKSKYKVTAFKNLVNDLKNGVEIRNYVENGGVRYLRVTDLGKNGLNNNSPRFVLEQDVPDKIKLNSNCILISRSGSLGLINIVEPEIENCILSSHIFKVELKTEAINPVYLEAYLRSQLGQSEIFRNNNGGVIPEINQDALKSILIVVPPIEKQKEIAEHVTEIRRQAQKLKDKTQEAFAKASQEIEEILLGNA